ESAARETPAIFDEGSSVPIARFFHFGGVPINIDRLQGPPPRFLNLLQSGTERCLEACARERGVRVEHGHEVIALDHGADEVALVMATPLGEQQIRARYVIGCDGGHSRVRALAGIEFPGSAPTQVLRLGDVKLRGGTSVKDGWGSGGRAPFVRL